MKDFKHYPFLMVLSLMVISSLPVYGQTLSKLVPLEHRQNASASTARPGQLGLGYRPIQYPIPKATGLERGLQGPIADSSQFSWEDNDALTPVKNQGSNGTCWIFCSMATVEAREKLDDTPAVDPDYSEQDVGNCNANGNYDGGNSFMVANHLSRFGTVNEADEPYTATQDPCDGSNPLQKTAREWHYFGDFDQISDVAAVKELLENYGPLSTVMSVNRVETWNPNFSTMSFDGNTVVPYLDSAGSDPDHGVVIVGWDDNLAWNGGSGPASGTGAWRVRNSWGTAWGDGGYFWVAYGSVLIGADSAAFAPSGLIDTPASETLLQYDEFGWQGAALNYGDDYDVYQVVRFTPTLDGLRDHYLTKIALWNRVPEVNCEVRVYAGFDGTTLGPELTSAGNRPTNFFQTAGYFTLDIWPAISLTPGQEIAVWVRFTDTGEVDPSLIPVESQGVSENVPTSEPNRCYVSADGTTWDDVGDGFGDLGIRAWIYHDSSDINSNVENWKLLK